ncbi:Pls/PosA family non-ribosomal peptide synthetase [Pseudonocardia hispaniensis]|uniref:Pls/PosA family non-ribosomal peptide synthetase n=1 Tax=Pseudonocardia hispaniensis TaxID=904933 RepID=A0ABW1J1N9_9PSEU
MGKPVEALSAVQAAPSAGPDGYVGPTTDRERILAEVIAGVVHSERVSIVSNFFDDLGADSMMMTHFCARARKRGDLPSISMKDVYRNPTIKGLAAALEDTAPAPVESPNPAPAEEVKPAGTAQYILCGTLQLLLILGYVYGGAVVSVLGYTWVTAGSNLLDLYARAVLFGGAAFAGACILPILAKWLLIGRWKPQQIRIWSLAYVRFWAVRTLVRANPLLLIIGGRSRTSATSPLYSLYLRTLGARVGRGVAIYSRTMPVCTDLLTIGDGTTIRKDASFTCFRAHAGQIQTGPVTLGKEVFVGEASVLDIETSMGDGAQLGHASTLNTGQTVPDGERWHGAPAQRADVDYSVVPAAPCGTLRRLGYAAGQLLVAVLIVMPAALGVLAILLDEALRSGFLDTSGVAFTYWDFYHNVLIVSSVLYFGAILLGFLVVVTVPRILNLVIKPDTVYLLYGIHYSIHRAIAFLTNRTFFRLLFGDSSYIVHYLRCIGYDLSRVDQTGSNFGTEVMHETPYHVTVGSGTMVADGLSIINADFSSTSFRVSRVSIGPRNFLGNRIAYPAQSTTGENCLLATKVLVPIDGNLRTNQGLLGSPSFEIPRSVERDSRFDHLKSGDNLRRGLSAKNRYNLRTMALLLLVRWVHFFGVMLLALAVADYYRMFGAEAVAAELVISTLFTFTYFVVVERAVARFRPLRPQFCSIYNSYFWWHERYWKLVLPGALEFVLSGTPFKNIISRMLGVRLGRKVFDDGCAMPERTLVSIGDACTLNAGTAIQCHSQEDGTFKSDRSTLGSGCTLGVGAFVHYGVTVSDGAVLAAGSFLMKGEEMPPNAQWAGNPAREIRDRLGTAALTGGAALTGPAAPTGGS